MNHASSLQHVDTFLNMCCMVHQLISPSYWSAYRLPTPVSTTTFMAIPFILRQTANLVVWHGLCTDSQLLSHFTLFFQSINIARFASYCSCQEPQHPNSGWNINSYHSFFFYLTAKRWHANLLFAGLQAQMSVIRIWGCPKHSTRPSGIWLPVVLACRFLAWPSSHQ